MYEAINANNFITICSINALSVSKMKFNFKFIVVTADSSE